MNILGSLTILQLRRAIEIKEQIAALENELQQVTERQAQDSSSVIIHPKRRMSAAGRRRIAAVQKARWARLKADRSTTSKKKFWRMSVAARAAIAEAQRRRWAAIKAAKA